MVSVISPDHRDLDIGHGPGPMTRSDHVTRDQWTWDLVLNMRTVIHRIRDGHVHETKSMDLVLITLDQRSGKKKRRKVTGTLPEMWTWTVLKTWFLLKKCFHT